LTTIGERVPSFSLPATGDQILTLGDFEGKRLVLYFYPKDHTEDCTNESRSFARVYPVLQASGVCVLGVSRDSVASHERFKQKFNLPFELASDSDLAMCRLFNVAVEKNLYGRMVKGIERSTFLIDEAGILVREWRKVKVKGHCDEVLAALGLPAEGVHSNS